VNSDENALMKTGQMPALLAFSYFVVALFAMEVGIGTTVSMESEEIPCL
jgi:hypothetical protein